MKRFFLILMLLTLPLQMSWAAVSIYCQHETGKAAQHFGHHVHTHQAQPGDDSKSSPLSKIDKDCSYCHLSNVGIFTSSSPMFVATPASVLGFADDHSIAFTPPDRPERPKWTLAI